MNFSSKKKDMLIITQNDLYACINLINDSLNYDEHININDQELLYKLNQEWHKENNTGDFHTSDITHNSGITYSSGNIPSESNSSYIQTLNIKISIQINVEKKT
ncbi:hypothetical protein PFFVO_04620 [Plasmodium falciparum Vietnam Oak-Knoll (FVO)]|nr:hypothetical protein PFFVO_04620 [Plasmodium falciparum Vietnam Oak-Knoll (FVO)]ETW59085.1 hypothetical protein PFMC_04966 [Plasmodium falciparum CAMP/Malaysia]EWC86110.1 hypothetical protein PFNF54_04841 [Plasmodium falciparum NF54]